MLRDVSLHVRPGERIALMGPSGVGKSTLGALVARFFDPVEGRVLIDGRDARDCSLEWLRDQVAVVLQDTVLFSGTVHDNIAYATDATREQVEAVARAAAADDFIRGLPEGYETDLGPQGVALSGGQRQRIGIARTLLRNPPVLVLDEPTTGLDSVAETAVLDGLKALMDGRTTILITHSKRLADTADRVVRLGGGSERRGSGDALPLEQLLDHDEQRALIARALGDAGRLGEVEIGRVVYKPGDTLAVHYRAEVDGERRDAVATRIAGVDLAELAGKAGPELAQVDPELGALVTWLPFDPKLPALAEDRAELERRLGLPLHAEPELLGYKPRARAVLRANGLVLKAYGAERQFAAAVAGLRAASAGPLRTGAFAGAVPELRLTAQRTVEGRRPESAQEAAEAAGRLVAELQGSADADPHPLPAASGNSTPPPARPSWWRRCSRTCARAWRRCSTACAATCRPPTRPCPRTATSTSTSCWSATRSRSSTSTRCAWPRRRSTSPPTPPTWCAGATGISRRSRRRSRRCSTATAPAPTTSAGTSARRSSGASRTRSTARSPTGRTAST